MHETKPLGVDLAGEEIDPVTLPPGLARLATKPSGTGSSLTPNTTGMVEVAALAASEPGALAGVVSPRHEPYGMSRIAARFS